MTTLPGDRRAASQRGRSTVRKVLVDSRTALNYEMVAPVMRAMAHDDRVEFALLASEAPARVADVYASAPTAHGRIAPWRAALARWDAYLTSDFMWATLPRGTARVQMYHGVAGKYGFDTPTASLRDWDRLFFINQRRLRHVVAAGAIDEGSSAIRLIGMPKVDCLVDGSLRRDDVLDRHGLNASRPTVLYAPTWSPHSSLNRLGRDVVERLVRMPINVVVKLHDRSFDPRYEYSGGVAWKAVLSPLLARAGARLAEGGNITPWLAAADAIVTDHSSAAYEYLLLDRPVIRIEVPELLAAANVHPDYVQLLASASHNVTTAAAAAEAVDRALADARLLSASRRYVASELFYRPGTATARACYALYELMALPPPAALPAASAAQSCALPV